MATRSLIIVDTDDTVTSQYCHWDGGLNGVGNTLATHYTTSEKLIKLRKLGALSVLAPNCTKPKGHTFNTPVDGHCISYKRDLKEKGCNTVIHANLSDAIESAGDMIAFVYVFTNNNWHVHVRNYLIPINQQPDYMYVN